jgi:hypothetical protein
MGCHAGLRVQNATELKKVAPTAGNRTVMIHPLGVESDTSRMRVYCDITSDSTYGWHLVFTAYPRIRTPYVQAAYDTNNTSTTGNVPTPSDTDMRKFSDDDIKVILNNGIKQTRTQWWHTSEVYGSVWADGNLNNASTQWNEFDNPNAWYSDSSSAGATFRRRRGGESWSGTITSAGGGCSGAVGGWSNYYEQSCVQSWFCGCEGTPCINHACATGTDRAQQLHIWAA